MPVHEPSPNRPALDYLFHPGSIAVVGVSGDAGQMGGGRGFVESLRDIGFKGGLFPVNLEGGETLGLKVYTSLRDIPYPVDYVISAIPAKFNLELVRDCGRRGIRALHVFSAGFGEIADPAGKELETRLVAAAREAGVRIIGPNCMGLYCPGGGLAFFGELPRTGGSLALISQSGGNSAHAIREIAMRGVYFSKAISFGNAADLNESDFLEYLAADRDTAIITGYLEGVKDGARFAAALRAAARAKPVIIYKAGTSEEGSRAIASHTGSLAGSAVAWDSLLRQAGAIQVHSVEELADVCLLFKYMSPPTGRNVALMGIGGGAIVQSADECARDGLILPPLPPATREQLVAIYGSEAGASFRNPVDMYWRFRELTVRAIEAVAECESIDLLMVQVLFGVGGKRELTLLESYLKSIIGLAPKISKKTAVVLRLFGPARFWPVVAEAQRTLVEAGYPVYLSAGEAARAIVKYVDYHRRRKEREGGPAA